MHLISRALLASTLLLAGRVAPAQQSSTDAARFAPLAFLVGHCWEGAFPDGKQRDEHCFEWAYDGKFIRDRHVVHGAPKPYSGETLYAWDATNARIGYWYFASDGMVLEGYVQETPEGLVFPSRASTTGAGEIRSVWVRRGEDGYSVKATRNTGSEWKTLFALEMKRTK